MNLLLDTHAFLWFIAGDSSLSQSARSAIEDLNNNRYLSVASLWEIAIKVSTVASETYPSSGAISFPK